MTSAWRAGPYATDRVFGFFGVLLRHRFPRRVETIGAEAGVSRSTAYRYLSHIERLGVLPLLRVRDSDTSRMLVGVDWPALKRSA